ncbi:MAG: hypothetical protein HYV29_02350 [Ignavibacteriales bacterium]|nr:hypothetical protein [Ignavibacteriales bacterium]
MSFNEIESAISNLDTSQQQQLLNDLPRLIKMKQESFLLLKVSEPSFEFWENTEDAIYDNL